MTKLTEKFDKKLPQCTLNSYRQEILSAPRDPTKFARPMLKKNKMNNRN